MTDDLIEAVAKALAISWFGSGVDEWAVAEVRPDAEAMLRAAAPALMEEGARLALEAAAELITPGRIEHSHHAGCSCVYCEGWRDVHAIQALDPAAIVKGAGHDRD